MSPKPFELPVNVRSHWFNICATAVFFFSIIAQIFELVGKRDPWLLIPIGISSFVFAILFRRLGRNLPSKLESSEDVVCIYDVPSFWIEFNGVYVPIICKKVIRVPRESFVLEWIGSKLTWNDLDKGRSIFLTNAADSSPLLTWFRDCGIPVPERQI